MLVLLLLTVPVIALLARLLTDWRRRRLYGSDTVVVGFFHPYCNAGGGGERVLWAAVDALLRRHETSASPRAQPNQKLRIVVYTGDTDTTGADILARTRERFNIALPADAVDFVFLRQRSWVEAKRYPYFTLLGQSVGSMVLGLEAFVRFVPDVYIGMIALSCEGSSRSQHTPYQTRWATPSPSPSSSSSADAGLPAMSTTPPSARICCRS